MFAATFLLFISAVFSHWYVLMAIIAFIGDFIGDLLFKKYREWRLRNKERLRFVMIWVGMAGLLFASFLAFKDEHSQLELTRQQLTQARQRMAADNTAVFWPKLTDLQERELAAQFKGRKPERIDVNYSDSSGVLLASDLDGVFRSIGWQTSLGPWDSFDTGNIIPGLTTMANPNDQSAKDLKTLLRHFGLNAELSNMDYRGKGIPDMTIVVGIREP